MGIRDKLSWYKSMLIDMWEIGAEQGRDLQKSHGKKIKRNKEKEKHERE